LEEILVKFCDHLWFCQCGTFDVHGELIWTDLAITVEVKSIKNIG
jgi:hypothetical protein